MTIQCPHCNVSLDGEADPGEQVECPACGKIFVFSPKKKFVVSTNQPTAAKPAAKKGITKKQIYWTLAVVVVLVVIRSIVQDHIEAKHREKMDDINNSIQAIREQAETSRRQIEREREQIEFEHQVRLRAINRGEDPDAAVERLKPKHDSEF